MPNIFAYPQSQFKQRVTFKSTERGQPLKGVTNPTMKNKEKFKNLYISGKVCIVLDKSYVADEGKILEIATPENIYLIPKKYILEVYNLK